ncbi:limonene-1,2-epoxide hydrolase family protein [Actinomycetospora lutea]|uniref:nuclear transport factor 2 family protein n=1 Tax=Actinomycetospora lutea TaxID=663604 RepID=UPI002365DCB2|nr:limonene-1,2-epoxide hydrolase family protein [Actinomycetospora lutea]MDD7937462.1 limonene-1,2-epoxide hydrolase family protein [Actinomycetospora lutea]
MTAPPVVTRFLAAVEARDPDAAGACFTEDGTWANVPHPPVVGPAGVRGMLAPILARSQWVRWDIVTAAHTPERSWLERVDRFGIDGTEYAVACHGVVEVDPDRDLITDFRDYVDLGEWRARLGTVLQR